MIQTKPKDRESSRSQKTLSGYDCQSTGEGRSTRKMLSFLLEAVVRWHSLDCVVLPAGFQLVWGQRVNLNHQCDYVELAEKMGLKPQQPSRLQREKNRHLQRGRRMERNCLQEYKGS